MKRTLTILSTTLLVCLPAMWASQLYAELPELGNSATRILSPEQESGIGRQVIRQLRTEGWISSDAQVNEYLQSLGQRLASHGGSSGQVFNFYLVESADVNAFAVPGGYIGLNAGLFMNTRNESELAGVIAHEIAHVTQRHIARAFEQANRTGVATTLGMLAAVLIGASTGQSAVAQAGIAAGMSLQIQDQINHTRTHEYEADRIGIGTLAAAGFDPEGMVTMFEQMDRRARLSGTRVPPFLSTHPVSGARISEARARSLEHGPVVAQNSRAYGLMRARARALVSQPTTALEYFTETMRGAAESDQNALRYGRALALTRLGRHDEARPILQTLLDAQDDVLYFHLALADLEYAAGNLDAALQRYQRAMRMFPGNTAVTIAYAEAMLHADRPEDAIPALVSLLPQREPDPQIFRLLAVASGAAGKLADAHYFMSETHVLNGQVRPAVDQLQLALAIPGINSLQRSRAEARLEQLVGYLPRGGRMRLDQPLPPPPEQDTGRNR
jgi:beta-barrel assembly-enhancing protease